MRHPTDEEIQDLVDGVLDASRSDAVLEHLGSCAECRAAVAEVESLLEAAAGLAVGADPPPTEWERIEALISSAKDGHVRPQPSLRASHAAPDAIQPPGRHAEPRRSAPPITGLRRAAGWILFAAGVGGGALAIGGLWDGPVPMAEVAVSSPADAVTEAYAESVSELELIFARGAEQLAPETLAVIEENLLLIEEAVDRARSEIARDPGSSALAQSLNSLYGAKVRVLAHAVALAD